jgi:glycyl-tRNA synthetase beta chain
MPDLILELLSEEIPARMQAKARADLARLLTEQLAAAGLQAQIIDTYATPRRLALIARGLPLGTPAVSEELKGPRTSAPPQALEGFLRKTGLAQDQLTDRDGIWFAVVEKPGRATTDVLAEAIPAIVRAFPWPKSMRWGAASITTESPRWVRPLQGIVAMLDEELIDFEIGDVRSSAATIGHRFHHPGRITLGGASDYVEKLRACHVIVDQAERETLIRDGAAALAAEAGLALVPDEGLVQENAGLTEWPVPLLGHFDQAFLEVPREVIQLTMRTNQKYFALQSPSRSREGLGEGLSADGAEAATSPPLTPPAGGRGELAPAFICVANIAASDGGARIVEGNQKVLAARLSDARFFWEHDLRVPLEKQAEKLGQIVFHEKLGTLADKVERVRKLAAWLVEEEIVKPTSPAMSKGELASFVDAAARICKADLVTGLVGEFPELQGVIGGHLALCQGHPDAVCDAVRDHYKPVGQGDEVPTAPVTVAVSLADKLDTLVAFFFIGEKPSGSRDPFALRRAALGALALLTHGRRRLPVGELLEYATGELNLQAGMRLVENEHLTRILAGGQPAAMAFGPLGDDGTHQISIDGVNLGKVEAVYVEPFFEWIKRSTASAPWRAELLDFLADRLKVQQREARVRHDLIDAVFALGGEDDLVRLLARVRALQAFVETPEGADLLAGYKRAANILKKEGWVSPVIPAKAGISLTSAGGDQGSEIPASAGMTGEGKGPNPIPLSYTPENAETALISALDSAEPEAAAAVERENFEGAMRALATLRAPVDAFFTEVTVNDPDPAKRAARLDLLARMRDAVHRAADFSRIEG